MNFDANALLLSMLIGSIGFVLLIYGKKQARAPHLIGGLALMIYPYFVSNLFVMGGVGVGLMGAVWLATRLGW